MYFYISTERRSLYDYACLGRAFGEQSLPIHAVYIYMYFYISTERRWLYDYAGLGRAFIYRLSAVRCTIMLVWAGLLVNNLCLYM